MMPKEISDRIAFVAMVCAVLVVTIHTPCEPFIQKRLLAINAVAVPLFFLISGYLFAGGTSEPGWYAKKVSSRVKSLLVPYVVWNVMYWLPVYIAAIIANAANVPFGELSYIESRMFAKWDILGLSFLHLPVLSPLWYLRVLFVLALLSPIFLGVSKFRKGG